jgi:hypothetical protein
MLWQGLPTLSLRRPKVSEFAKNEFVTLPGDLRSSVRPGQETGPQQGETGPQQGETGPQQGSFLLRQYNGSGRYGIFAASWRAFLSTSAIDTGSPPRRLLSSAASMKV